VIMYLSVSCLVQSRGSVFYIMFVSGCWHSFGEPVADFDAPTKLMLILNAYDTNALFCCLVKTNLLLFKKCLWRS